MSRSGVKVLNGSGYKRVLHSTLCWGGVVGGGPDPRFTGDHWSGLSVWVLRVRSGTGAGRGPGFVDSSRGASLVLGQDGNVGPQTVWDLGLWRFAWRRGGPRAWDCGSHPGSSRIPEVSKA